MFGSVFNATGAGETSGVGVTVWVGMSVVVGVPVWVGSGVAVKLGVRDKASVFVLSHPDKATEHNKILARLVIRVKRNSVCMGKSLSKNKSLIISLSFWKSVFSV